MGAIAMLIGGLVLLVWGGDRFIDGAGALARRLGIPVLVVGVVVVGFGTSAPELLVSAMAAWGGHSDMAYGNAVGSNIANVGLILGLTALVLPVVVQSQTLRRELPLMLIVMALAAIPLWGGTMGRVDAAFLLTALVVVLAVMVRIARMPQGADPMASEFAHELAGDRPLAWTALWLAAGLAALLLGSRLLVAGATDIAQALGISDLVIGLTIVAVGTSLPELAASIASALKREPDIAVGNIIGSNIFNLLAVMGVAALIGPGPYTPTLLTRDYPVMMAMGVVLFLMTFRPQGAGQVNRLEGAILLVLFCAYLWWVYTS